MQLTPFCCPSRAPPDNADRERDGKPKKSNNDPEQREIIDKRKKLHLIPSLGTCAVYQSNVEVVVFSVCWDGTVTIITSVQCSIQAHPSVLSQLSTRYPGLFTANIPGGDDDSSACSSITTLLKCQKIQ